MSVLALTRSQQRRIVHTWNSLMNLVVQKPQAQAQAQPQQQIQKQRQWQYNRRRGTINPTYSQKNVSRLISSASESTPRIAKGKKLPSFYGFPITFLDEQHTNQNVHSMSNWKQMFRRINSLANENEEDRKGLGTKSQRKKVSSSGKQKEPAPNDHAREPNSHESAAYECLCGPMEDEKERLSLSELQVFLKHMEAALDAEDPRIGVVALRIAQEHDLHGGSPHQILAYAKKALTILGQRSSDSIEVGICLHLAGSAYYKMGKHKSSLESLSRALEIMNTKEYEGHDCRALKFAVHFAMGDTMAALGRHGEALKNYRVGLSIQETLPGPGDRLAYSCRRVAEAYTQRVQFEEALPLCLRALQIHRENLGDCSMEEACDRRLLAVIYRGLDDYKKALEEHLLVKDILTSKGQASEDVDMVDIAIADLQISSQHYIEAVEVLQSMIPRLEETNPAKGLTHVNLARAFFLQGRMDDSRKECEKALEVFSNSREEDSNLLTIAQGFTELASIFEGVGEAEQAIELLEQALSIYSRIPGQIIAVAGAQAQIGMLLYSSRNAAKALPFMEDAASRLKDCFGDDHPALALVLNHMGLANLELKNFALAIEFFERCKHIFTASFGAGHADTIAVFDNLVKAYICLDRYDIAVDYQKHILNQLKGQGTNNNNDELIKKVENKLAELLLEATNAKDKHVAADKVFDSSST